MALFSAPPVRHCSTSKSSSKISPSAKRGRRSQSVSTRAERLPAASERPWNLAKLKTYMPLSKELLDILVCPVCKESLELKPDESGLKCVKCKRVYPVRDNIPVMLVDEAQVEE
jgi:uncharacterized protein YbaR (Trm112 family)